MVRELMSNVCGNLVMVRIDVKWMPGWPRYEVSLVCLREDYEMKHQKVVEHYA